MSTAQVGPADYVKLDWCGDIKKEVCEWAAAHRACASRLYLGARGEAGVLGDELVKRPA